MCFAFSYDETDINTLPSYENFADYPSYIGKHSGVSTKNSTDPVVGYS